jgi:hypothetical protein
MYCKRPPEFEKPLFVDRQTAARQCFLLKSRNEPLGGAGKGLFGVVASQIILERVRSIGDKVIASRYMATNASANIKSIPAETRIASRITGITAPAKNVIVSDTLSIHHDYKIESYDYPA